MHANCSLICIFGNKLNRLVPAAPSYRLSFFSPHLLFLPQMLLIQHWLHRVALAQVQHDPKKKYFHPCIMACPHARRHVCTHACMFVCTCICVCVITQSLRPTPPFICRPPAIAAPPMPHLPLASGRPRRRRFRCRMRAPRATKISQNSSKLQMTKLVTESLPPQASAAPEWDASANRSRACTHVWILFLTHSIVREHIL